MEKANVKENIDTGEIYDYQIIEFVVRGPKNSTRQTDILPSWWINFNKRRLKLEAQYLPPPYTPERCKVLHHLVQNKLPPINDWPFYTIKLIGQASKYFKYTFLL